METRVSVQWEGNDYRLQVLIRRGWGYRVRVERLNGLPPGEKGFWHLYQVVSWLLGDMQIPIEDVRKLIQKMAEEVGKLSEWDEWWDKTRQDIDFYARLSRGEARARREVGHGE